MRLERRSRSRSGMPAGKVAKGPRPRQAVGKHGAQKSKRKPWLFHGWVRSDGLLRPVRVPRGGGS